MIRACAQAVAVGQVGMLNLSFNVACIMDDQSLCTGSCCRTSWYVEPEFFAGEVLMSTD